jgi:hypothetical protein
MCSATSVASPQSPAVRREVVRPHGERALVESNRAIAAAHAVRIVRAAFRVPAQQEQLDIRRVSHDGLVKLFFVGGAKSRIVGLRAGRKLFRPYGDAGLLALGDRSRERRRALARLPRALRRPELAERIAQPEIRHRQILVSAYRLVEGPGSLDPDVRVKVRQPLVAVCLRTVRPRGHRLVSDADALAEWKRTLQKVGRDRSGRVLTHAGRLPGADFTGQ